jgi:hypothetical protein
MAKATTTLGPDAALLPSAPGYADFVEFGRETIAMAINSNASLGAGLEAIGEEVAQYSRATFESAGQTARSLIGARTLDDVVRLQTDFASAVSKALSSAV